MEQLNSIDISEMLELHDSDVMNLTATAQEATDTTVIKLCRFLMIKTRRTGKYLQSLTFSNPYYQ